MTGALIRNTDAAAELAKGLDLARARMVAVLPASMSPDRIIGVIQNEFQRNPRLRECTPPSIVRAVVQCAELGLDPSPKLGQAWFIGRSKKLRNVKTRKEEWVQVCELQIGYKGILKKAYECERILSVDAVLVHEKDRFELQRGTHPDVLHEYGFQERGAVIGAYFAARLTPAEGNVWRVDDMSLAQLLAIRDNSSDGWKAFQAHRTKSTPWKDHEGEMMRKTMLVRGLKTCPISDSFRAALEADADDMRAARAANAEGVQPNRGDELKAKLGVPEAIDVEAEEVEDDGLDPNTLSHNLAQRPEDK